MTKKTDITESVSTEIVEKTIDLTVDYTELGIDALLDQGILQDIPFVKSVVGFYNITNSVVDRHKVKKILTFFKEFHEKEIDEVKLNKFKEKFSSDKNYQDKVVDTIILLNERFLQIEKSKILANLVRAHIEENLTWQELQDVSYVLDSIHPKGFDFLAKMSTEAHWGTSAGNNEDESLMFACGVGHRFGVRFSIRPLGQKLYTFGIKPLKD